VSPDSSLTDIYARPTPVPSADLASKQQALRRGWGALFGLNPTYQRLESAHVD
jgi:hypothetical protein